MAVRALGPESHLERGRQGIALEPFRCASQIGKVLAESRQRIGLRQVLPLVGKAALLDERLERLDLLSGRVVLEVDGHLGRFTPAADDALEVTVHHQEEAEHEEPRGNGEDGQRR